MTGRRLSRRLVAVWLLLAALLAIALALEYRDQVATRPTDPSLLLPIPVDELGALEVAAGGAVHRFERDGAGAWFYHGAHGGGEPAHAHQSVPETTTRIEQAVAAFGRTRIERRVGRGAPGQSYGVTNPQMIILAYRRHAREPLARYAVGDVAPDTLSRYVDVGGSAGVVTIPGYQVDNLLALIEAVAPAARPSRPR